MEITIMDNETLEYRASMSYNEEAFFIRHGALVKTFMAADANFGPILKPLHTERDISGNAHVSLAFLVLLLQRQSRAAFQLLVQAQSYQAWLIARPGIECALILGKWADDPRNATIWRNRLADRQAYNRVYQGDGLCSTSLTNSRKVRSALGKINDYFAHANHAYFDRHLELLNLSAEHVGLQINYVDDDMTQEAHTLAFLHLLFLIEQDLADFCARRFGHAVPLQTTLDAFRNRFSPQVEDLFRRNPQTRAILDEMGSWNAA